MNTQHSPAALARSITLDCTAVNAQDTKGHRYGICPSCTRVQRLGKAGLLARHGWQARNVRHGQNTGFHIGGHGALPPIGTERGNALATTFADSHRITANHMEAQAPFTTEDAIQDALVEIHGYDVRSWEFRRVGDRPVRHESLEALQATSKFRMYSGWFTRDALASRVARMTRYREATIAEHRMHAEILDALVAQNPA
jgi:hypothetical protein